MVILEQNTAIGIFDKRLTKHAQPFTGKDILVEVVYLFLGGHQ